MTRISSCIQRITLLSWAALTAGLLICFPNTACTETNSSQNLQVQIVSPHPDFLFTDQEQTDVRVSIIGKDGPVTVEYTVSKEKSTWHTAGQITVKQLKNGIAEQQLPLKLPGRGLYELSLTAHSGQETAHAKKWIGVVFQPAAPSEDSPWGMFCVPWTKAQCPTNTAQAMANNIRTIGASWVRFNFWVPTYDRVTVSEDGTTVTPEVTRAKEFIQALRNKGLFIMGEFAQMPWELSSKPDASGDYGDAGPLWARLKPRDYKLWDQFAEKMAAEFKNEITYWEIWNEADQPGNYWSGTTEEFAELIMHTSKALRKGNPKARVVISGFTTNSHSFVDKLLQLGVGKYVDVLSIHYTDGNRGAVEQWKLLLAKYNLKLPIWNTEDANPIPLNNRISGIEHTFKFIYVGYSSDYSGSGPILRNDLSITSAGIAYSVGAHCLGNAKFVSESTLVPDWTIAYFRRGREQIAAIRPNIMTAGTPKLTVTAKPLSKLVKPVLTDNLGNSIPLKLVNGKAFVTLNPQNYSNWFINGCSKVEVTGVTMTENPMTPMVFEAENGRYNESRWRVSVDAGYSGGKFLDIWETREPDANGYFVEVPMHIKTGGTFEVLFAGDALTRLANPRSISSFLWSIDGGEEHIVNTPPPIKTCVTASGLSSLGTVTLEAGQHKFLLRLHERRLVPDTYYALWFDAIVLQRK